MRSPAAAWPRLTPTVKGNHGSGSSPLAGQAKGVASAAAATRGSRDPRRRRGHREPRVRGHALAGTLPPA